MAVQHGTRTRYNYGCRCALCKRAQMDYQRNRTGATPKPALAHLLPLPERWQRWGWESEREALAWAAGFFEGEGTLQFVQQADRRNPEKLRVHSRIVLSVAQAHPEVLEKFRDAVGVNMKIRGPYRSPSASGHHREIWYYRSAGRENTQAIVAKLWPFLSTVKRTQTERVLGQLRDALAS